MTEKTDRFSWHRRAQDSIAHGALTNSKRPNCFVQGIYPTHLARGQGCWLWDHSGKKYLDFITGMGTSLLGYAHPQINAAIVAQMHNGASLSLSTHHEVECAEMLKSCMPFIDAVRFLKTGTEACMAAVKIARAKTGRSFVLSEGYHGWSDDFVSMTPPAIGIPTLLNEIGDDIRPIGQLEPDNLDSIKHAAAVIVEPIITDASPARIQWLQQLRNACTKYGVMLIFDEIITGFRFPKHSVACYTGIIPDIICLGKALANGMPLAAVGGKYDVMNCAEYFVSSTYAGETLSLVAATATMRQLQTKNDIEWLWKQGQAFLDEFNSVMPDRLRIDGFPVRGVFVGDTLTKALFWQEAVKAGMLFGASWWMSFPMAEEYKNAMGAIKTILERVKRGEIQLEGELPASPFAQRVRENGSRIKSA